LSHPQGTEDVKAGRVVAARPSPIPSVADAFPAFFCLDSCSPCLPTSPATFSRNEAGNFLLARKFGRTEAGHLH